MLLLVLLIQDADRLIRDLGDEDYDVRESASSALYAMDADRAAPILQRARMSRDPEVRARALALLAPPAISPSFRLYLDIDEVRAPVMKSYFIDN